MMKPSLSLLSIIAAVGCGDNIVGDTDEDPTNPDNPNNPTAPLTPAGTFRVQSELDLATNMPGTPGLVVNYFIKATDDPDDPTKFIVDELINQLSEGPIKNAAKNAAPLVTGYLNDRLLEVAPALVTRVIDMGNAFGDAAKHFGTLETVEINAAGQAVKVIDGVHFEIDGVPMDFLLKDYGVADIRVEAMQVVLEPSGKLTINPHTVPVGYGTLLKLVLDKAIIPMIDPSSQNVGDILKKTVNCQKVGQYVYNVVGLGSASTFQSACTSGLNAASNALYGLMTKMDTTSKLEVGLTGIARGVDKDKNGTMDEIQTGTWSGSLTYAGTPAALPEGAKFFGTRM